MSVQQNNYIVLGMRFPFLRNEDDRWEPYMDSAFDGIHHHNGLCVISDGMNGEYTIIGMVLAKSKNHQGFETVTALQIGPQEKTSMREAILGIVGQLEFPVPELSYLVFTHYR